jgi:hypothetical protein
VDARSAGQELVAVLEAGVDVGDGQRANARGGELERERDALEPGDQLGHGRRFLLVEDEARLVQLRPLDEQAYRGRARERLQAVAARRHGQRQHREALLAGGAQQLAARGQDAHVRRRLEDRVRELRRGLDHVLAVVEDQQGTVPLQVRADALQQRPARLLAHAERLRRLADDEPGVADRREVEEPDAVGKFVDLLGGGLQREARLAEPAHAEQREQARRAEQAPHLRELALAADERGRLVRQVVRDLVDRHPPVAHADDAMRLLAVRRRHQPRLSLADLEQLDRLGYALELPVAVRCELVRRLAEVLARRLREQGLAGARQAHHARRDGLASPSTSSGFAPRATSSAGFSRRMTGPTCRPARAASRVGSAARARW